MPLFILIFFWCVAVVLIFGVAIPAIVLGPTGECVLFGVCWFVIGGWVVIRLSAAIWRDTMVRRLWRGL